RKRLLRRLCARYRCFAAAVSLHAAREAGVPYRTAQRWVALSRQFGLAGLVRKARAVRNERRTLSLEREERVEGLALQRPPLPVATLHRQVFRIAEGRSEKPPRYGVIYDFVRRLAADRVALA